MFSQNRLLIYKYEKRHGAFQDFLHGWSELFISDRKSQNFPQRLSAKTEGTNKKIAPFPEISRPAVLYVLGGVYLVLYREFFSEVFNIGEELAHYFNFVSHRLRSWLQACCQVFCKRCSQQPETRLRHRGGQILAGWIRYAAP